MASTPSLNVDVAIETWPLASPFVISRGAKTQAHVVVVTTTDANGLAGRGECVPYARYGETPEGVARAIANWQPSHNRETLLTALPAGAARNAVDCALWDLAAKRSGKSVADHLNLSPVANAVTALTVSLDTPDAMATAAKEARAHRVLKLKLGGNTDDDIKRMQAVRAARADARLLGDANEGWGVKDLSLLLQTAADLGFETIEQPLPANHDAPLADCARPIAVCADESHHTAGDLESLVGKYDAVNIKLDKAGGLTAAHHALQEARMRGFEIMIGSMVATSLAVAPAYLLACHARWLDLDGPLLMAEDRANGFLFDNGKMHAPEHGLWGTP